jgi:hypothetical protein
MPNIGFGLDNNETAQETGFDKYKLSLSQTLGVTAEDTWHFNPLYSIYRYGNLLETRSDGPPMGGTDEFNAQAYSSTEQEPLIPRDELNRKYSKLGLLFEQDEKQSTVDLLAKYKKDEIERNERLQRGQTGVVAGTLKFATGLGVSMADPINIASAFIPIVGEARFASLVAKQGFTTARLAKGAIEGGVGAALIEPIVYGVAQAEQADYGLMDSLLNVTFGTVIGGGLHVGIGALKDYKTNLDFKERIQQARESAGIDSKEDPAVNLYKEYYPINSETMLRLAETDPETRRLLLVKSMSDLLNEKSVDVTPIANLDPKLRDAQINDDVAVRDKNNSNKSADVNTDLPSRQISDERTNKQEFKTEEQNTLDRIENTLKTKETDQVAIERENKSLDDQLNVLKEKQKDLNIEDSADLQSSKKQSQEITTKQKEIKDAIIDGINCINKV